VANIVGSNIFNALAIVGVAGLTLPLPVLPEIIARDNWCMVLASALLLSLMRTGMRISRGEGGFLVMAYGAYLAALLRDP
jgi:cation:H+ antiporter